MSIGIKDNVWGDYMDTNFVNSMIDNIKKTIENNVNEEYTKYKQKCLEDLDYTLEMKRNSVVKNVLDGIDVVISSNEPFSFEPTILIKVEKKIVIKE